MKIGIIVTLAAAIAGGAVLMQSRDVHGQSAPTPTLSVEIDMLSGMPNPTFELDAREAAEVKRRLSGAPRLRTVTATDSVRQSILGYRGVIIRSGTGVAAPTQAEVSNHKVLDKAAGEMRDGSGAGIERYLFDLAKAKKALTPEQVAAFDSSIP
jgi:hypothetical protein